MTEIDTFGPALRAERERRDLTIAQLGERAGLDTGLIERIENGTHDPYLTELVAIARALDMSAAELVASGTTDQRVSDDSIGAAFPAHSVEARFVISMGMAKNDVERALRDVMRAGKNDDPDFSYRVRLSTGHLVEALDALAAYSERHEEVRKLLASVPLDRQQKLKVARGTLQNVGSKALQHVRDNTFHYPSPKPNYNPTSDEQLAGVLSAMDDKRAVVDVDFEERHVTLSFADEVALALAMGKHAPTREEVTVQFEATRDGALAFISWVEALVVAYFEANGVSFGTPEPKPDLSTP